jgi:CHAD domain-containing protein
VKARRVKQLDPRTTLAENAARIVKVRLAELRSFPPEALDPAESVTQHDMRIAAKRLRYVLEATDFCFGRAGSAARKRAKDIQDLLGEVHDADVMLPRLYGHRSLLRDEDIRAVRERAGDADDLEPELASRAPHRTTYRGFEVLEVYLDARRDLLFTRFVALWEESEKRGVWKALERAADRELERAEERRRIAERAERARAALGEAELMRKRAEEQAASAAAELADAERDHGA